LFLFFLSESIMKKKFSLVLLAVVSFMVISLNIYLSTNRIVTQSFDENPIFLNKIEKVQSQVPNFYYNIYNDCNHLESITDKKFVLNKFPCDLLITVKSTQRFHESRLRVVIDTWFGLIPNKVNEHDFFLVQKNIYQISYLKDVFHFGRRRFKHQTANRYDL
jgi:hypothetical protein